MTYEFVSQRELPEFQHFSATPLSGALGAEIHGVQIGEDLPQVVIDELHRALLEFKVIFFRDQRLDNDRHLAFARRFGMPQGPGAIPQPEGYPMIRRQRYDQYSRIGSDVNFHVDDSFRTYPSKFSILHAIEVPRTGGDTIWVDMEKAFAALSPAMQRFLEGLTAEHNLLRSFGMGILRQYGAQAVENMMKRNPPAKHPLVRVHPDTGRKCIFANELLTDRVLDLSKDESEALLQFLYRHSYRPEFECRFRWQTNSVAMWDNRCTQHRGINDFFPAFRLMQRIPLVDERRPSRHPETESPLEFGEVQYVNTEDLFETKPEMAYGARGDTPLR